MSGYEIYDSAHTAQFIGKSVMANTITQYNTTNRWGGYPVENGTWWNYPPSFGFQFYDTGACVRACAACLGGRAALLPRTSSLPQCFRSCDPDSCGP